MPEVFVVGSQRFELNLTDSHYPKVRKNSDVSDAISYLESYPFNTPLSDQARQAADCVFDAQICLSPHLFVERKFGFNPNICAYFVEISAIGEMLHTVLANGGAFKFVDGFDEEKQRHSRHIISRVLAIFCVSGRGIDDLYHTPIEYFRSVNRWFRSEDGLGWNDKLIGASPHWRQVLRSIFSCLGSHFNDSYLIEHSGVFRSRRGSLQSWASFEKSKDRLKRELFARVGAATALQNTAKLSQAAMDFCSWLEHLGVSDVSLQSVFANPPRGVDFLTFLVGRASASSRHVTSQATTVKKLSEELIRQFSLERPGVHYHSLITDEEISAFKHRARQPSGEKIRRRSRPLPPALHAMAREIWEGGEHGWPGTVSSFYTTVTENGVSRREYCPVIPTLILSVFDLPLRLVQFRRFDSGEGDLELYNPDSGTWETNPNKLAGYWLQRNGPDADQPRGYARKITDGMGTVTGFFINTNKTGDPYEIPWQHESLHKRLWQLRLWQERYNPVDQHITPEQYVDSLSNYSQTAIQKLPDIIPLFRMRPTARRPFKGRLVSANELQGAWAKSMAYLEERWNELNPGKKIYIVKRHAKTGQPHAPTYNLHGIRSRGLTDLYLAGIPAEIVSKIVAGHATVFMLFDTYLNIGPGLIDQQLRAAAENAPAVAQLVATFNSTSLDELRARTVTLDVAAREEAYNETTLAELCNVDIGLCPWDCSRCGDGGKLVRKNATSVGENIYEAVPGGKKNCILCRHFVTGPQWLPQLEIYGTKLFERRCHLARRQSIINKAIEELHSGRKTSDVDASRLEVRRSSLTSEHRSIQHEIEIVESCIFNLTVILSAIKNLLSTQIGSQPGTFLSSSRDSLLEYVECSQFESSLYLTQASRIYPVFQDDRVERARDEYLNQVMFDSAIAPVHMRVEVTAEERTRALDLFGQLLLDTLQRSDLEALGRRQLRLQDLGLDEPLRKVLESALSEPLSMNSQVRSKAIPGPISEDRS
jgi:hypothetical protein